MNVYIIHDIKMMRESILLPFVFGPNDLVKDFSLKDENGWIEYISVKVPNFVNNIWLTIKLFNKDDVLTDVVSYLEKNKNYFLKVNCPANKARIEVLLSGFPGGSGGVVYVRLYIKEV